MPVFVPLKPPYIIAEIGVNHECNLDLAKHQISLAYEGGANAVKFQTYKANLIASKHSPSYWDLSEESCTSQYQLFQKYDHFSRADYEILADFCNELGITFLSTCFDLESLEFIDPLVPFHKVSSSDITNIPFLRASTKQKPVFLSTGCSSKDEISRACSELLSFGAPEITLLHCVLSYPTDQQDAHLLQITQLQQDFPSFSVGYSDHTKPTETMDPLILASLLGATVIEKHFTHDKNLPGNDHYHSMDINDLRNFHNRLQNITYLLGKKEMPRPCACEASAIINARRSIVTNKSLRSGHQLTESDLICKRPCTGISSSSWDSLIGKTLTVDLEADVALQPEHIEGWT